MCEYPLGPSSPAYPKQTTFCYNLLHISFCQLRCITIFPSTSSSLLCHTIGKPQIPGNALCFIPLLFIPTSMVWSKCLIISYISPGSNQLLHFQSPFPIEHSLWITDMVMLACHNLKIPQELSMPCPCTEILYDLPVHKYMNTIHSPLPPFSPWKLFTKSTP